MRPDRWPFCIFPSLAMMAELITACEAGRNHDADPLPFHLPRTDRTISIGFFSRNRKINPESSFSVLG